jgi:DNA-binding GntR family transcriptional regulator
MPNAGSPTAPRRGIAVAVSGVYLLRKSKGELVELIQVWAALESMSARLSTLHASDAEIGRLTCDRRRWLRAYAAADYSTVNIAFHDAIMDLGGSRAIQRASVELLSHVRLIRRAAVNRERAARFAAEDREIMRALEQRRTERAEWLTRTQALALADEYSHCWA